MNADRPHVAYVGHHGSTLLLLKVHARLVDTGVAAKIPAFITFNSFWRRRIRAAYPDAPVHLFPNKLDWMFAGAEDSSFHDRAEAERAWQIDKILRHRPFDQVASLWRMTRARCRAFLEESHPKIVVSEVIQSLPCYALYVECRERNIPFVQIAGSRLPGRMDFFLDETGMPYQLDTTVAVSDESRALADGYLRSVVAKDYGGPSYMASFKKRAPRLKRSDIGKGLSYLQELLFGGALEPTSPSVLHPFVSKWRARNVWKGFSDPTVFLGIESVRQISGRKLLFPLHVTPEASTDLWAPAYSDMLKTATGVVAHLPPGWTLVIKEHPASVYLQRRAGELDALRRLPRSLLISPDVANEELLTVCDAVLAINGTFGLEAMMKGHRVVSLGRPFYDLSGNTFPCERLDKLGETLERALATSVDPARTRAFLARYFEVTGRGNPANPLITADSTSDENVRAVADSLSKSFLAPAVSLAS